MTHPILLKFAMRPLGALLLSLATLAPASAQTLPASDASASPPVAVSGGAAAFAPGERGQVEVGVGGADLSDGQPGWSDAYLRGHVGLRPGSTLHWSLSRQRHFGESGTLGGLTLVHELSPDWYALAGVAGGSASFQNRLRLDAGLYRKWGAERRWVTGLGLMHARSGDHEHRDHALRAVAIYYAPEGWVGEGGVSFNRSSPGAVWSTRFFGAATFGQVKQRQLTLRLEHGQEGYLPLAAGLPLAADVRFRSTEATLEWRQWIDRRWGFVAGAQFYRNPYYRRAGLQLGLFWDF